MCMGNDWSHGVWDGQSIHWFWPTVERRHTKKKMFFCAEWMEIWEESTEDEDEKGKNTEFDRSICQQ